MRRDRWAAALVCLGGVAVVATLLLILAFLVAQSLPLLRPASTERLAAYVPTAQPRLGLDLSTYGDVFIDYGSDGSVAYRRGEDGALLAEYRLPPGASVTSFAQDRRQGPTAAFGLDDGTVLVLHSELVTHWPAPRQREITVRAPRLHGPLPVSGDGRALERLALSQRGERLLIAAQDALGRLWLAEPAPAQSRPLPEAAARVVALRFVADGQALAAVVEDGRLGIWDLRREPARLSLAEIAAGSRASALASLEGGRSLVLGFDDGGLEQWLLEDRAEHGWHAAPVRRFAAHAAAIVAIEAERGRRGFASIDATGGLALHHASSGRTLWRGDSGLSRLSHLALSPERERLLLAGSSGQLQLLRIDNPHPEVSLASLWRPIHYEGRERPALVWQSASASDDLEPKFSLVPLTVGTLKAAFFAMLFAMPLALAAAVYTAFFLAPPLRAGIKPAIELMEALPTVVIGFLAGLWLAPWLEAHLMTLTLFLCGLPPAILVLAAAFTRTPAAWRRRLPAGWELIVLLPLLMLAAGLCLLLAPALEQALFGGTLREWLATHGIGYEQRNAIVVGMAMGVAVVPTVFSIAEDAVFSVPRHLAQGALALGATAWQAIWTVVLPTASPGLFAAVMIGCGRAAGETMIVLMASGNSPVVNFNPFEGLRTLSATLAVELPEAAAGSTHYRVLFLAGLLLLLIGLAFNGIAEAVRQRLRQRYARL